MIRKKFIDMRLVREADRRLALRGIAALLKESGCIEGDLENPGFGRHFKFSFRNRRRKNPEKYLLPLRLSLFHMDIDEAEARKRTTSEVADIEWIRAS